MPKKQTFDWADDAAWSREFGDEDDDDDDDDLNYFDEDSVNEPISKPTGRLLQPRASEPRASEPRSTSSNRAKPGASGMLKSHAIPRSSGRRLDTKALDLGIEEYEYDEQDEVDARRKLRFDDAATARHGNVVSVTLFWFYILVAV